VGQGRATAWVVDALASLGRLAEAIERAEEAFGALGDAKGKPADEARVRLAERLAWACARSGAPARGLEWAEQALTAAERIDDQELLAQALSARALSLYGLGRHHEAVLLVGCELELAVAAGSLDGQARAKNSESLFVLDDDPRRALEATLESAELARRAGLRDTELLGLFNAAESAIFAGDWETARRLLAELEARRLPERLRKFWGYYRALLDGLSGDPARALERFSATAATVEAAENVDDRATYYVARAVVHLAAGDCSQAFADAAVVVAIDPAGINSAEALSVQAHAALWAKDLAGAQAGLSGMAAFGGRWMKAVRRTTEAGIAALEGRVDDAVSLRGGGRGVASPSDPL